MVILQNVILILTPLPSLILGKLYVTIQKSVPVWHQKGRTATVSELYVCPLICIKGDVLTSVKSLLKLSWTLVEQNFIVGSESNVGVLSVILVGFRLDRSTDHLPAEDLNICIDFSRAEIHGATFVYCPALQQPGTESRCWKREVEFGDPGGSNSLSVAGRCTQAETHGAAH